MSGRCQRFWQVAVLLLATGASAAVQGGVKVTVNVLDAKGVGFNDTTPTTPVGGNTGTTVGQQRMIVFQAAADAWGRVLESPVPIVVEASFAPLDCVSGGAIEGQAAPYSVSNYPGLPTTGTYPVALASKILGKDLKPILGAPADITAQFNGGLKACMQTVDWYYGLDGQKSKDEADLLSTVMHELTHGLGFSSDVDPDTGEFSLTYPAVFSYSVLDTGTSKHWSDMTNAERKTSLLNARKVVWDGKRLQSVAAWEMAKGMPSVQAAPSPSGYTGFLGEANFGRLVADGATITGQIATGTVASNCSLANNNFSGKIALITSPESCASIGAAAVVEKYGGLAMLFAYNVAATPPPDALEFSPEELAQFPLKIPTLAVTRDDANLIGKANSVTLTISADTTRQVGADSAGHTLIFASNPVQPGSTGSHWDPLVRPNLLLEPVEQPISVTDLVMERALLWDIGWTGNCGNGAVDSPEECDSGATNSDRTPDACRLDCTKAKCGDGVVDSGEQCDPGTKTIGVARNPNCGSDCRFITAPGTGGAGGSGGSSGKGGISGSGGTNAAGGATGNGGTSGGASGGTGSGGSAGSSSGGSGGATSGTTAGNPGGKSGGCGCYFGSDSPASGFALLAAGLAFVVARRRRSLTR